MPASTRIPEPTNLSTTAATAAATSTRRARGRVRVRVLASALTAFALLALVPLSQAQSCGEPGMNGQCTEFGSIAMEGQRDIRGDPIGLSVTFTLNTAYADQGSRWLLVSVRNVESDGSNPVTIDMQSFSSAYGDILTTRVEQPSPSELNLWVETLDTPVGTPIVLDLKVGATDRGAFQLETLVMAFDRGYAPVKDSAGNDASLFSFTLLGVNEETSAVSRDKGSLLRGNKVPGIEAAAVIGALVAVAFVLKRRV